MAAAASETGQRGKTWKESEALALLISCVFLLVSDVSLLSSRIRPVHHGATSRGQALTLEIVQNETCLRMKAIIVSHQDVQGLRKCG